MVTPSLGHDRVPSAPDVRSRLVQEGASLRARASKLEQDMSAVVGAAQVSNADDEHDPEGQTIAYERSQLAAMISQTDDHLREVDAALERVAAGTFGICEVCAQPIPTERLEARPTARTCVRHAPGGNRRI